jgi:hypothetical protein
MVCAGAIEEEKMNEIIGDYLEVELINQGEKTNVYLVINRTYSTSIGRIKWNPGWRQYCFFSEGAIILSAGCMKDICKFIDKLMAERKQ